MRSFSPFAFRRGLFTFLAIACVLGAAPLVAQPLNTSCASSLTIPGTGPFPYSIQPINTSGPAFDLGGWNYPCLTGKGFNPPYPAGAVSRTVWFSFTPAVTDTYRIDTAGSTPQSEYDTILEVYTGICGSLQLVTNGCDDDAQTSLQAAVNIVLNAGTTYYISVSGVGGRDTFNPQVIRPSNGGTLQLTVGHVPVVFAYSYVIPSVAHSSGITTYVSDFNATNLEGSDGIFTVQFLGHGNFGDQAQPVPQPITQNLTIPAFGSRELPDIVQNTFGLNDYGALLVQSTKRLFVGARIYTASNGPTGGFYGQYVEGVDVSNGAPTSSVILPNETGRFIGIREDADTRTNFVLFNPGSTVCSVALAVRDASGNPVAPGGITKGLPPRTMVQANRLKNVFGITSDIRNASLVVTNLTGGCTIGGVAYVVDGNVNPNTNDPFTVTFRK
jgi:hypothetical protein